MYVKVESSGVCERKGLVQVRFSFYLDEKDYGYEKHHVRIPIIPEGGYPGKVNEMGAPSDEKDYQKWVNSLPKEWVNNPFHNHFIYVSPETPDDEIMDLGEAYLEEAYIKWACEERIDCKNYHSFPEVKNVSACESRVTVLKSKELKRSL